VTEPLPASAVFGSATATQGTCARTPPATAPKTRGGTLTCHLGTLGAGATATVTIAVTPTTPGTLTSIATGITPDSDDTATAATTVQGS
jgi:uncharacterized protein DUF11